MSTGKRAILILLVLGMLFTFMNAFNIQSGENVDNDTFWHIKTGEYIFTHREAPQKDVFSWYGIENDLRWINHEWLYALTIFIVHDSFGMIGVMVFTALVASMIFLLLFLYIKIRTNNDLASLIMAFVGISGIVAYIQPRPFSISALLLLSTAIILERKKWFWVLPLIFIGVNMHGGFYPMYILLVAYYAWRRKPVLILLALLTVTINPYWIEMITYPLKIQMFPDYPRYITEWSPSTIYGNGNHIYLLIYLSIIISVFNKKMKIEDIVFSLVLVVQTFSAIRHMVFLFLLIIPILSPYIVQNSIFANRNSDDPKELRLRNFFTGLFVLIFVIFFIRFDFNREINTGKFPTKAIQYIKDNQIERVFNMYDDGGFLIYNNIKPMIDGRADIFSPIYNDTNLYTDFIKFYLLEEDFVQFLDKYKIENVLVKKNAPVNRALEHSKYTTAAYQDEVYVLYKYSK